MLTNNPINKKHTFILYIGVFFFVIGWIVNLYFTTEFNNNLDISKIPLLEKLSKISPFYSLLLVAVIAPIIEEFSFRSWTINTIFFKISTLFLITTFFFYIYNNAIGSLCVFLLLIYFIFMYKGHNKILFLTILTSVIFAFLHLPNSEFLVIKIGIFFITLGIGLILCFIASKFALIYSMLAHFIYNALLITPIFFNSTIEDKVCFSNQSYSAKLNFVSILNTSKSSMTTKDSLVYIDYKSQIAVELCEFNKDTIFKSNMTNLECYELVVKPIGNHKIDKKELLFDYIAHAGLLTDTVSKKAYLFSRDTSFLSSSLESNYYLININSLVLSLRNKFNIPLKVKKDVLNKLIKMELSFLKIKEFDEVREFLKTKHGLVISKEKTHNIIYINYQVQNNVSR